MTETHEVLRNLLSNNSTFAENSTLTGIYEKLNQYTTSGYSVKIDEPYKILGELMGSGNDWNRLSSILREKESEIELLKKRIYDIEKVSVKSTYSGVDNERTIMALKSENAALVK